jgi:competence ComEA-like helix-hairpin-helix protein
MENFVKFVVMSLISKLQGIFGVSKSELGFAAVLLSGLLLGFVIKPFGSGESGDMSREIYRSLDSLADAHRTTYIGTDINNEPFPELAKGDTVVKKTGFPIKPKAPAGKVNINTASKLELMKLPGVGEKTALKIMEMRVSSPFAVPEDIKRVKGIGEKKYEKMKMYIEV